MIKGFFLAIVIFYLPSIQAKNLVDCLKQAELTFLYPKFQMNLNEEEVSILRELRRKVMKDPHSNDGLRPRRVGSQLKIKERNFTIEEFLGGGFDGNVYKVVDDSSGNVFSIKEYNSGARVGTLSPDIVEEIKNLKELEKGGRHVTKVHGYSETENLLLIDYVDGVVLEEIFLYGKINGLSDDFIKRINSGYDDAFKFQKPGTHFGNIVLEINTGKFIIIDSK